MTLRPVLPCTSRRTLLGLNLPPDDAATQGAGMSRHTALGLAAGASSLSRPIKHERWRHAVPEQGAEHLAGLEAPRVTAYRHVHHYHALPGPTSLIGWDDPSRTGDHYAISRYAAAFSLQFDHLARVIGNFPAHIALGAVVGILWGVGVRQSIHSIMLTNRALRRMKVDTKIINAQKAVYGDNPPIYLKALARRNRHVKWSLRYGMGLDAVAGFGASTLGIGVIFRHPLIGEIAPALQSAAIPVLTGAFFPLVIPSVIGATEKVARSFLTMHKVHAVRRHLKHVEDPRAEEIGQLYKHRQHELARYFALDALARASLVAGSTLSVFVGPGGLLLLVPAILALITSECFARRMVNVDDTFALQERFTMRNDTDYFDAISLANNDVQSVQALRVARHKRYPRGWGTAFRPALRLYRKHRGDYLRDSQTSAQVLAAFDRRDTAIGDGPTPDPIRVMDILDAGRVRSQFAEAILRHKKLRQVLRGHGVTMQGRKWSVDADALAMFMLETRWNTQWPQETVDALYELAEEVLLTHGRVEHWRRLRALLDYYGRFARACLRDGRDRHRVATQRKDS